MADEKPFGLTPVEINTINIAFGSSYNIPYSELGFMVSAIFNKMAERHFRPRFLSMCGRGLMTFESWKDMSNNIRYRKVVHLPRSLAIIKDIGKLMAPDNEAWRYYSMFDPYTDYSKNPSLLDKFSPYKFKSGRPNKRRPTRRQILLQADAEERARQEYSFG